MKEGTKNLLMIGGVVVLGYYLLNKSKKKKTSIVNVIKTDVSDVEKVGENIIEDVADL
jgi:hemerythrin superfamily protein|tara:strand:+ start:695 stop:868 length:174 start_codon:yes stop_codon:yes gene_type:complete